MNAKPEHYKANLDVISLRGRLTDYYGLQRTIDQIEHGRYIAVIVDAHYRMLAEGVSENDNAQVARVFNLLDRFADQTGAAWFLIHHNSKGGQSEKRITDVGSGAGSHARAADAHLILREHEVEGHCVLDAAVRSWAPFSPVTLEWLYPMWLPSDLDPTRLKGPNSDKQREQERRDRKNIDVIVDVLQNGSAIQSEICKQTGLSRDQARRLLDMMVAEELTVIEQNGSRQEYRLVTGGDVCVGGL